MNAFEKIAKKAPASKSKANKLIVATNNKIKELVDKVAELKAEIKTKESERIIAESSVIDFARPLQDKAAREGNFVKSLEIQGKTSTLTYTTSDKFSVPADEDTQVEIRNLLGQKTFDEFFETTMNVGIKSHVLKDDKLVNKIVGVLQKAGIEDIFEVTEKLTARKGLDQKQYNLDDNKLKVFRTLVPQYKPALK